MRPAIWILTLAVMAVAILGWAFAAGFGHTPPEQQTEGCSSCNARHQDSIQKRNKGKEAFSAHQAPEVFPLQTE